MTLVFLDAGILIGALLSGDPRHAEARPIVEAARRGELAACTSAGVLSEVYAALTWIGAQPPQTPELASQAARLLVEPPSAIVVLPTNLQATLKMLEIASNRRLTARRIHDARHAATALVAGVNEVYTYDTDDWRIFQPDGITIVGPPSVLADN
ncbi:type II toxin-antitoxin system VapC family toxin [Argonema galeatum]|uniref:type II toxin-antitoxin system VapC family toxin n=1 Tax=Argonema galeatum TaxID=2942762 RepID=UPI0020121C8D|nr:type II toxin-antitoxin system VapC family toxin [Argonema galeatum]MCL1466180.1 type II toxin-antitoxin system VapC family toxin [Argonema galeatum A003/A1]